MGEGFGGAHRAPGSGDSGRVGAVVAALAVGATGAALATTPLTHPHERLAAGGSVRLLAGHASDVEPSAPIVSLPAATSLPSAQQPTAAPATDASPATAMFSALHVGTKIDTDRQVAEEIARRPKIVLPAVGAYTSQFAMRWGEFHGGIDLANAVGTPEYAAMDGKVIDAGPASGFGQWVRIMSDDGVMTVYGHMSKILVHVGQRVTAGQLISLMGSEGFSTGPHLHFEVWINNGKDRIDPDPWLRQHGVQLPAYTG